MKIVIHKRFETRIFCSITKINKTRCWLKPDVRRDFIHNHCCNGEEEDPAWTEINFTEAKGWRLFKIGGARGEDSTLCQIPGGHSGNLGRGVKPESIVHWVSPRPEQAHENFTTTSVRWMHKILNMLKISPTKHGSSWMSSSSFAEQKGTAMPEHPFQDYNLWVLPLFHVCGQYLRWQERELAWDHTDPVAKPQLYLSLTTCAISVKTFKICELVFSSMFIVFNSQIQRTAAISKGPCEN